MVSEGAHVRQVILIPDPEMGGYVVEVPRFQAA